MIIIRPEIINDIEQIRQVNLAAFGLPAEANIVNKIRVRCSDIVSLVAEDAGVVVGHILFSPVLIKSQDIAVNGMGLAPMAVLPNRQRQGIGSMLVRAGLKILRDRACPFVTVLGHSKFYPKFGFELASKYDVTSQWPGVPDEAFMILLFDHTLFSNIKGVAWYMEEFNEAI